LHSAAELDAAPGGAPGSPGRNQEERMAEKPQQKATKEQETAGKPQDPKQDEAYVDIEPDEEDSSRVKGGSGRH
jgi:hypothetical protein